MFFTTYNVEEENTLLEVNASQRDKDYIAAVNWKKAEEYIKAGKYKIMKTNSNYLITNIFNNNRRLFNKFWREK